MNVLSTSPLDNRCFSAEIASKLEDINAAVIIQQLHYWMGKENTGVVIDGVRWVYNSFESWVRTQFKWLSVWQFRKSMSLLRSLEIVKVIRYKARQWNQTNYYTLNYKRLNEILGSESTSKASSAAVNSDQVREEKTAESTEKSDLCATTDQDVTIQQLDLRDSDLSYIEPKNTSRRDTAKQTVAAPPENEELKPVDVLEEEIGQPEVNGLKQENKANSGVGNGFDGKEANSATCSTKESKSIKVVNKNWKSQVDELDGLGVGINHTVVRVVKTNQKEDVEKAIALLRSRKRDGYVSNPAGFLVKALKENWGSEISSTEDSKSLFRYWYDLARELGYCQGQEVREGEQWVNLGGVWEKWSSAVNRGYTVEYLRKVLGRNKNR